AGARDRRARRQRVAVRAPADREESEEEGEGLGLAARAEVRRSRALDDALDRRAAAPARHPRAVVHQGVILEVARLAVAADEIAQARAARLDGRAQRELDRRDKLFVFFQGNFSRPPARLDPRAEQALARVDVADTDHALRVHEELLDRNSQASREPVQARAGQRARQRLDAEVREQRVAIDVATRPEHRAKAARIAQAQALIAEQQVEVIVLARRRARRDEPQAARHAEMKNEVSIAAIDQQIFAAPANRAHLASRERTYRAWNRPAQPRLAHCHGRNDLTDDMRCEPATGDLDFGQFRHRQGLLVRGTKYT